MRKFIGKHKPAAVAWVAALAVYVKSAYQALDLWGNGSFFIDEKPWRWTNYALNPWIASALVVIGAGWVLRTRGTQRDADNAVPSAEPPVPTPPQDEIDLYIQPVTYEPSHPWMHWVHVRVRNHGSPDSFVAQVIDFRGVEGEAQTQYRVKWRETAEAEQRIYTEELLNFAQINEPEDIMEPDPPDRPPQLTWARILRGVEGTHTGEFKRGSFRLFSVTQPQGWLIHGSRPFGDTHLSEIPRSERPLLVFDEQIELRLRVTGTRGQQAEGWVTLGFLRATMNYDTDLYDHHQPRATIRPV